MPNFLAQLSSALYEREIQLLSLPDPSLAYLTFHSDLSTAISPSPYRLDGTATLSLPEACSMIQSIPYLSHLFLDPMPVSDYLMIRKAVHIHQVLLLPIPKSILNSKSPIPSTYPLWSMAIHPAKEQASDQVLVQRIERLAKKGTT